MKTGKEELIYNFPTPQELWNKTFDTKNNWKLNFNKVPYGGRYKPYFYQEITINKSLNAIAKNKNRIL